MTADFNFYINRQGARGRQGEKGEQGFSPAITVNTDTAQEYKLNIETENDLIVTPNLKGNPLSVIPGAGKYVLFDEVNNTIYNSAKPSELVDTEMFASTSDAGIIRIADDSDITEEATDAAVTPKQLADAIDEVESTIPTDTVTHTELTSAINGVASQIPDIATSEAAGIIKPDGITTTVSADGTLTAIQSAPVNMVTLDTEQTISANKRTTADISFAPTIIGTGDKTVNIGQFGITLGSGLASTSWNVTTDRGDLKFAVNSYGSQSSGFTFTNNFTTIRLANTITIGDNTVLTNASVDGTTITYDSTTGKISAVASAPINMVTTNTAQSITGEKTFNIIGLQADNNTGIIRAVHENGSTNFITAFFDSVNQQYTLSVPGMTTIKSALGVIGKTTIEASEFVRYKSNVDYPIVDTSMLDNTTIAYDGTTGKISSISSAPTVIDGGEEV